jgi:hypothetical protein
MRETRVSQSDRVAEQEAGEQEGGASPDAPEAGGRTRRRAPGADPEVRSFGSSRVCAAEGCETTLSRYNPDTYCSIHRGWDRQVVHRQRRNGSETDDED